MSDAGLDPLTIIYGKVSILSERVDALKNTSAPISRVEAVERDVADVSERITAAIQQREAEREQAVELLKNGNDNRTKVIVTILGLVQAAIVAWIALGSPTP